jgi:hypothetical protein
VIKKCEVSRSCRSGQLHVDPVALRQSLVSTSAHFMHANRAKKSGPYAHNLNAVFQEIRDRARYLKSR